MTQYQAPQPIEIILNDTARVISDLTEELSATSANYREAKRAVDEADLDQDRSREILEALITDMKNLATNQEIINGSPSCRSDPIFINKRLEELKPLIQREAIKDPKFIPNDFFITGDIVRLKEAVRRMLDPPDSTFSLFTGQFLTNIFLNSQLGVVTDLIKQLDDVSKRVLRGAKMADLPRLIVGMQEAITTLRASHKQIHTALKKTHSQQLTLVKAENENKTRLSQLELTNQSLKNDIEVLTVQLRVANSELLLKKNEQGGLSAFASQLREGAEEHPSDAAQRCPRLEEALDQKAKECSELSTLIKELQTSLDDGK
jgi:chromosome segregation ATPase